MNDWIKRYLLYLLRWQLSTPILAVCITVFATWGYTWSTIVANFIGGLIFFWIDRCIFYHRMQFPIWEINEETECADCHKLARAYRLVKYTNYDKTKDLNPEFRCEQCSAKKYRKQKQVLFAEKGK